MDSDKVLIEKEFLQKLVRILDSKEYEAIFVTAAIHGYKYIGDRIDMVKLRQLAGLEN